MHQGRDLILNHAANGAGNRGRARKATRWLRGGLLAVVVLAGAGCARLGIYSVSTTGGPAREVPEAAFDLPLGATTAQKRMDRGWALAERRSDETLWVKAVSDPAVRDVEAQVRVLPDGHSVVDLIRVHFARTRWATYEQLLQKLLELHGQPQSSVETESYEHFSPGLDAHRMLPSRFVVHRWSAPGRDLVLVAGLEVIENMRTSMEYQLLLIRAP